MPKVISFLLVQFLCLYFSGLSFAQRLNGSVIATDGSGPISGANVRSLKTGRSVVTDVKGQFILNDAILPDTLIFTHVSYLTLKFSVGTEQALPLQVRLSVKEGILQEVTINTGYQTIPKERATGSFVVVEKALLNRSVSTDLLSRLEGVTNGLQFDRSGIRGENRNRSAPELRVRGIATIEANSSPLIVVDNFPFEGELNSINPNDIENVTILKDAAAASIWGALAGNGVIVITTKQGRYNQKAKIVLNSSLNLIARPDLFYSKDFLPSATVMEIEKALFDRNAYVFDQRTFVPAYPELLNRRKKGEITETELLQAESELRNIDVRNEALNGLYQRAANQQYALGVSGGENLYRYYLSVGYDHNRGASRGNSDERLNLSLQNTYRPLKSLELSLGVWLTRNRAKNNGLTYETVFNAALGQSPYLRLKDEFGNALPTGVTGLSMAYQQQAIKSGLLDWMYRPLDEIRIADNRTRANELRLNAGLKYSLFTDLNLNVSYQYLSGMQEGENYYSPESYYARNQINRFTQADGTRIIPNAGILSGSGLDKNRSHAGRIQLNYQRQFGTDHELSLLGGGEMREQVSQVLPGYMLYNYNEQLGKGSVEFDYTRSYPLRPQSNGRIPYGANALSHIVNRFLTYFSNTSYSYKGRYILSGSIRWDGANLLGVKTNEKGTALWSGGLAWEISKEKFYSSTAMPYLRLRTTYGSAGNVDKSQSHYPTISYVSNTITGLPSANLISPGNPYLRWEQVDTWNSGLDFGLFKGRISGSVDYYVKSARDLLAGNLTDPTAGVFGSFKVNYGNMRTKGIDLQISTQPLVGAFSWATTALVNYSSNEITNINTPLPNTISVYFTNRQPTVGRSLDAVYAFPWNGLDHNTGKPVINMDGQRTTDYATWYNNYRKENLALTGVGVAPVYGSLRNTFSWKGLELSALITFKTGYVFRRKSMWSGTENILNGPIFHQDYFLRWQRTGDETFTNVPAASLAMNVNERYAYEYSAALVSKGDHIRLQDVNLSYALKGNVLRRTGLQVLRIYGYARNLGLIWTANRDGIDPEYPYASYPAPKSFALGLQAEF